MTVYAIPPHHSFLETFVAGLKERYTNSLDIARCIILLPTKRGCLSLKEILSTEFTILPRIIALSDLEEQPILPGFVGEPLPKAIPSMQRLGLLAQLIRAYGRSQNHCLSYSAALAQAEQLATLLDEIHTTGCDLNDLTTLVADEYAGYWQLTMRFLEIITQQWPAILHELGFMEPALRQRQHLQAIARHWRPECPVYLIGTTGTRPATAELAIAINSFTDGHVVLPGLTADVFDQELPPTHPQYTLQQFAKFLDSPVIPWQQTAHTGNQLCLLHEATATTITPDIGAIDLEAATIPHLITAQNIDEEIAVTALIIRHTLTTSEKSVAVVTPDQRLTKRLYHYLKRWDIVADSSLGQSLTTTAAGQFLNLIAKITPDLTAASWLSLLKHPFFERAGDRATHLQNVRQLELTHIRQDTPQPLFEATALKGELKEWYQSLLNKLTPLLERSQLHTMPYYIQLHRQITETLYGRQTLWQEPDGQMIAQFFETLADHGHAFGEISWSDYSQIFSFLLNKQNSHDTSGIGSRVRILGALEARLLKADVVILAGLNEKTWPSQPDLGPWLNRQMRLQLGLSDPERKIGLSAHDFCLSCGITQEVYITRSEKDGGAATIPSRWWVRLETIYKKYTIRQDSAVDWLHLARTLDSAEFLPILAPAPCPELSHRPKTYSATDIELLMRDPYSYYAKKILRFKKLPALQQRLSAKTFGQFVHRSLDDYQQRQPTGVCLETLIHCGKGQFSIFKDQPIATTFWWPRFICIAEWLTTQWQQRLPDSKNVFCEIKGQVTLPSVAGPITITAVADRLDYYINSASVILDYKTGIPPTYKDVSTGLAPQLPLEGWILAQGGFNTDQSSLDLGLEYWHLQGDAKGGVITTLKQPEKLISLCDHGIKSLMTHFMSADTSYIACPWGMEKVKVKDYLHLARVQEWL